MEHPLGNQEPHRESPPGVNWTLEDVIEFVEGCYDRDTILEVLMGYASHWFPKRMVLIVGRAWVQLFSTAAFGLPDDVPRDKRRAKVDDGAPAVNDNVATGTPEELGLGQLFEQLEIEEPLVRTIGVTIGARVAIVLVGAVHNEVVETGALEAAASAAGRQLEDVIRMAKADELPPEDERVPAFPKPREARAPGAVSEDDVRTTQNLADYDPADLPAEPQPAGPRMSETVIDDDSSDELPNATSFGLPFVEGEAAVPGRQVSESSAGSEASTSEASMTREGVAYRSEASSASEAADDAGTVIGAPLTEEEFPGDIDEIDISDRPTVLAEEPSDSEAIELGDEGSGVNIVAPKGIEPASATSTQLGGMQAAESEATEDEASEPRLTDAGTQIGTPKKIGGAQRTMLGGVGGEQDVVEETLSRAESEAAVAAANDVLSADDSSERELDSGSDDSGKAAKSWMNVRTPEGMPAAMILKPARKRRNTKPPESKPAPEPEPEPEPAPAPKPEPEPDPEPAAEEEPSEAKPASEVEDMTATASGKPAVGAISEAEEVAETPASTADTVRQDRPPTPEERQNAFDKADNPRTQQLTDSDVEEMSRDFKKTVRKPPPVPAEASDPVGVSDSSPPVLNAHNRPTRVQANPIDSQSVGAEESSGGTLIAAPNRTSLGGHFSRGEESETRKFDADDDVDDAWFDYFADKAQNKGPDPEAALNFSLSEPSDDPHTIPPETLERLLDSGPEMVDMQEQFMILDSRDREKAFEAAEKVAELGERAIEVLDLMFPGRVFLDRYQYADDMPPVDKHGPVLHALVRLGDLSLPVASRHLTDSSNEGRFYAVYLLTKLDAEPILPELFARLFDRDQQIRNIAADLVLQYQTSRAFDDDVRRRIRDELLSGDDVHITVAADLLAKLRDVDAVVTLIDAMDDSATPRVKVAILNSLTEITLHHWSSPYEWRQWWRKAKNQKRRDWIVEALDASAAELRQKAYEEVQRIPGFELNYHPDQPSKLRKRAQKELREWYDKS